MGLCINVIACKVWFIFCLTSKSTFITGTVGLGSVSRFQSDSDPSTASGAMKMNRKKWTSESVAAQFEKKEIQQSHCS